MSTPRPVTPPLGSNMCAHIDARGRRYLRMECPTCSPMSYRCIWCYQPARRGTLVATECHPGYKHITDGRGSRCEICGNEAFVESRGGKATDCLVLERHELVVYPFRCEACKGSVILERPTWCSESYDGKHLLRSGFIDLGVSKTQVSNDTTNIYRDTSDADYRREIAGYLRTLRSKRTTRKFVSRGK